MLNLRCTVTSLASRAWAYISASSSFSGKFADPIVMVEEPPEPLPLVGSPPHALSGRTAATTAAIATSLDFLGMGGTFLIGPLAGAGGLGCAGATPRGGAGAAARTHAGRDDRPLARGAEQVQRDREQCDEDGTGEDLVVLVDAESVHEQSAETSEADVRRDRGGRADLEQCAAQATGDQGHRHRHLGLEKHLSRTHAHPD